MIWRREKINHIQVCVRSGTDNTGGKEEDNTLYTWLYEVIPEINGTMSAIRQIGFYLLPSFSHFLLQCSITFPVASICSFRIPPSRFSIN